MSRANIGKLIGLSRFTTSEVTGEMVDNRILRELGPDNREGAVNVHKCSPSTPISGESSPSTCRIRCSSKERWRIFPAESWTAPSFPSTMAAASMT